ncbi:hypothetical protein FHX52_2603 [Humibacillus xanthopallidus]|uniref:Uncharacterized protein n=1 Tax=Humibacillus xanthopallidus TaxID=412689 RepID=A0A543PPA4_9MICO|nr:hypothetical protein [Humibacillus xanthopallidus]TQN45899.1 hypothetical protein FHX52_2603 [Humibacillus xanthopallidus]
MTSAAPRDPTQPQRTAELMAQVAAAQTRVRSLRCGAVNRDHLNLAQDELLEAMERYAAELGRRRLPNPRWLRDDLRLYREIRVRPDPSAAYRPRDGS